MPQAQSRPVIRPIVWTLDFPEPKSMDEAQTRRGIIVDEMKEIDFQLSDRDKRDGHGNRVGSVDYWRWRKTAGDAKRFKERELMKLNRWIREKAMEEDAKKRERKNLLASSLDAKDPYMLILRAHDLLSQLEADFQFTPEDLGLLAGMQAYIEENQPRL